MEMFYRWYGKMLTVVILITLCPNSEGQAMPVDVIVAQDGTGNFTTISDAIKAAPESSARQYHIKIREGLYTEYVFVGEKQKNIVLVGEGINKTIISGNKSIADGISTYETATVGIKGEGFVAMYMTFQNTAGPTKNQSVALRNEGNQSAFYRCSFLGYQDTLYTKSGYQFFRECDIYGTVDFIFGAAAVVFQNCTIYARKPLPSQSNTITAQKKESERQTSGTIIQSSTITATQDLRQQKPMSKTYLGRPWGTFSTTIIMQSILDNIVDPKGWLEWAVGRDLGTVFYAEYGNTGPGAGNEGRVRWSRAINRTEANKFTVRNFIGGDQWIPAEIPYFLDL